MTKKFRTFPTEEIPGLASEVYFLDGREANQSQREAAMLIADAGTSGSSLDSGQGLVASKSLPKPTEEGARIAWNRGRSLMAEPAFMTTLGWDAVDNAKRLWYRYGDRIAYSPQLGWLVNDGRRRDRDTDETRKPFQYA